MIFEVSSVEIISCLRKLKVLRSNFEFMHMQTSGAVNLLFTGLCGSQSTDSQ